jgi:hypothetical protein
MRRTLEYVSVAGLVLLWWLTGTALLGPNKLPTSVPTHFDAAGQATEWGSSQLLLGMPIGGLVLYALMTWVSRRPQAFNFPARVTPMNRPRLEALALQMIGWMKAEVIWLFAWIQHFIIEAARNGHGALPARFMPVTLSVVIGTVVVYFVRFRRTAA